MAVGSVLDVKRRGAQSVDDAPHHADDVGDVDAERAVLGAALAHVALGLGDDGGLLDKLRGNAPLFADHLPQGLFDLAHRRVVRVLVVGKVVVAGLGAKSAVDAGLNISFQAGTGFAFEDAVDHFFDPVGVEL